MSKKVGIYSGTFDPVHRGHLAFALAAIKHCGLDKVFFLVEPRPRRKQAVKAHEHRVEMVRLAIADEPMLGSIVLDQQRFTATETLPVLSERFKGAEIHMLMGDDMLSHFADWPQVDELINNIQFIIGIRSSTDGQVADHLGIIQKTRGLTMRYKTFQAPSAEFSSSAIKQNIKKRNDFTGLDDSVAAYIEQQGLYASSKTGS